MHGHDLATAHLRHAEARGLAGEQEARVPLVSPRRTANTHARASLPEERSNDFDKVSIATQHVVVR